ncbi:MAG: ATP-binding cassette domain-containing protein [Acidiferrobacterales bacterium]|nr:ATP-binding cassette domain-containing protein [Acidiferrobacterales bacterium]
MLSVRDLSVSIQRSRILHDVALTVPEGETAALIGRNGAGKTTLMRTIMGFIRPTQGRIEFESLELSMIAAYRRAHLGIGYMPEDRRLVPQLAVQENILLPVWATRNHALMQRLEWVYTLMPEIAQMASRKAMQLSGGQQKLTALARALVCGTKLLLLDEPFEGVAPALARRLAEVLTDLKGKGLSVLLSESDYTHSADLLDHLFVIERGVVEERSVT